MWPWHLKTKLQRKTEAKLIEEDSWEELLLREEAQQIIKQANDEITEIQRFLEACTTVEKNI